MRAPRTRRPPTASSKEAVDAVFQLDWSFRGLDLEKTLLELVIKYAGGGMAIDNTFPKHIYDQIAPDITEKLLAAGGRVQDIVKPRQIKTKITAVCPISLLFYMYPLTVVAA